MDNPQVRYNDDAIDAALKAYADLTPESINAFRHLGEIDAAIVIRILKASTPAKPKIGRPRGSKSKGAETVKPNGSAGEARAAS